jgi:hypothetical protein
MSRVQQQDRTLRERECLHRPSGVPGRFYRGEEFVSALYRLRGEAALKVARKVQPFFWADADLLSVWLCAECASEAGLAPDAQDLYAA